MKNAAVYLLSFLFMLAFLSTHFADKADSMLNEKNQIISESEIQYIVDVHKTEITFCRRPLTTYLVESASDFFQITIGFAFILVNFFLLGLSGILLFHLSEKLGATKKIATINMVVYLLCFSNVFAFFPPVYSYDEPLQYCLIFVSFLLFFQERWLLFILAFSLAIIASESSVILLPAMTLFLLNFKETKIGPEKFKFYIKRLTILSIPVLVYLGFLIIFIQTHELGTASQSDLDSRFKAIELNFATSQAASETIISFFIILGLPLYFLYSVSRNRVLTLQQSKLINAFLLTVLINTLVVLFMTKAREVRLFALPLFFIWPIFSTIFKHEINIICSPNLYLKMFKNWKYLSFFLFFNFLNYKISQYLYVNTAGGDDWFTQYLFWLNFVILAHLFLSHYLSRTSEIHP
ncbi:MAG: hypothetical protein IPO32_04480 [Crocinitomicaceae bacterium]|nr:hypothetical protein [Crocinitomicaceae bacterium]